MALRSGPLGESWRAWIALLIGVLAVSAHSASSVAFSVLMKPILAEFRWERADFAWAMNLRILLMVATISFAGQLTDRFGARVVLAGGALIVGAGSLLITLAESLTQFRVLMASIGPGQAGIGSVAASALVLRLFQRRRGVAIGILNGGDNLINALIPITTTFLLLHCGWRNAILGMAAAYIGLGVLILWVLHPADGVSGHEGSARRRPPARWRDLPWKDTRLWLLLSAYVLIYAFITSAHLHMHAFQTDIGHTPEQASRILSAYLLTGAVGAPLFGWIAERTTPRTALIMVVAGLTGMSTVLWTATTYEAFLAWGIVHGLVNSGVIALLTLVLAEMFGQERIGHLMGVTMTFCLTATMIGNQYSASMFDALGSYVPVWHSYTALMSVALLLVVLLRSCRPAAGAQPEPGGA